METACFLHWRAYRQHWGWAVLGDHLASPSFHPRRGCWLHLDCCCCCRTVETELAHVHVVAAAPFRVRQLRVGLGGIATKGVSRWSRKSVLPRRCSRLHRRRSVKLLTQVDESTQGRCVRLLVLGTRLLWGLHWKWRTS